MGNALEADHLAKRYRRGWALRDCTFELPMGSTAALVGANGAGKSTLLRIAAGLIRSTSGTIQVMGTTASTGIHDRVAFLAQDKPLYKRFTVEEMLRFGRALNATWDQAYARRLIQEADVPMTARVDSLSGGQQTRVALAVAMGRRPELLLLDEPFADLDPLARTDVMRALLAEVAEHGMTVMLSSHLVTDLEEACDHLVVLGGGRVLLDGAVTELLSAHRVVRGPRDDSTRLQRRGAVIESRVTGRQLTALIRDPDLSDPSWNDDMPTLEEIVIGYMRTATEARQ